MFIVASVGWLGTEHGTRVGGTSGAENACELFMSESVCSSVILNPYTIRQHEFLAIIK